MSKILIVEQGSRIYDKLSDTVEKWKIQEAQLEHRFVISNDAKFDFVIVDHNIIQDIEEFLEKYQNNDQMIVIVDYQDRERSNQFICHNIQVVYRNFGVSGLIYKLFGVADRIQVKAVKAKEENAGKDKKIVTVMSPTGGAGKSLLAFAMAQMTAEKGKKVLFIDLSIISNTEIMLEKNNLQTGYTNFFNELYNMHNPKRDEVQKLLEKVFAAMKIRTVSWTCYMGYRQ